MSAPPAPAHLDRAAATEIVEALEALDDPVLRRGGLFDRLGRMGPEEAAGFLNGLLLLAVERHAMAVGLLPLVCDMQAVTARLGETGLAALREAASETGRPAVVRLLRELPPWRDEAEGEPPDRGAAGHLPLGWRTQLGRVGSRDVMDRLLYDRDPRVIESLLRNSRCTEREVLRVAAHRPTTAPVLAVVFRHPKWIRRYRVKRALALNPYAIPGQVVSLLPSLVSQDLEGIARDETLHPDVARGAAALLAARGREAQPAVAAQPPALPAGPAPGDARPGEGSAATDEPGGVIATPPELEAALEEALREVEAIEALAEAAGRAAAEGAPEAPRQGSGAPGADRAPGRPPDDPAADR